MFCLVGTEQKHNLTLGFRTRARLVDGDFGIVGFLVDMININVGQLRDVGYNPFFV